MFKTLVVVALLTGVEVALAANTVEKNGPCPSNYAASSKFCVPNASAGSAIRVDHMTACPSGMTRSGSYCVMPPVRRDSK